MLTVAGSDSLAGAGLQADLKTFAALGVYGTNVVTVVTAQNSTSVQALLEVPTGFISKQFAAIFSDLKIAALKTGLLTNAAMIECVAENIANHAAELPLVIDPVISASSGRTFVNDEGLVSYKTHLLPMATLVTPNLIEAAQLLGRAQATNIQDMRDQAEELCTSFGGCAVLLKGGHLDVAGIEGASEQTAVVTDILFDGRDMQEFSAPFIETKNNRGTGCTLSAAITAELAKGCPLNDAIRSAKIFVTNALQQAVHWNIGSGAGPLNHASPPPTKKDVS